MPPTVKKAIDALSRTLLTGTDMELDDPKRTTNHLGLRNPLDDPSFRCTSYMAAHHKRVPPDVGAKKATYSIDAQRACAYHWADSYTRDMTPNMESAAIYSKLVNSAYLTTRKMQRVEKIFNKRGLDNDDVDYALANYRRLPKTIPDYVRVRYMELLHNAFPTSRRQDHAHRKGQSHLVHSKPKAKCHLCSQDFDDIEHLINDCTVARAAFDETVSDYDVKKVDFNRKSFYLAFDGVPVSTRSLIFLVVFLHCIIIARKQYMEDPEPVTAAVISRIFKVETGKLNKALHPTVNPGFRQDTEAYKMAVKARRSRVSPSLGLAIQNLIHFYEDGYHVIIYTDGSSIPNPGPSGAGIVMVNYPEPGDIQTFAVPCGHGSNNIGELHAIGHALSILARSSNPRKKVAIFSDSNYAMDIASGVSAYHSHLNLARSVRTLYAQVDVICDIRMFWLPGHADLAGNEQADLLAKEAVGKNTVDTVPVDSLSYPVYECLDPDYWE
jgi:ribonuclease HI